MLIAYFPLLICIIGLLMFVLASNAKLARIGEHMFWTGLLVTLLSTAGKTVHLF